MSIKCNKRPFKIYPNLDFWFENKPSGNPGNKDEVEIIIFCNAHEANESAHALLKVAEVV
jgi:hypothetical protein